jgi:uncharacterized protein (UPF0332 family)
MMDGKDFLEVAEALSTGYREAEWRSAVSRAYYAAFHVARRLLRQCGFLVPQGDQAHAFLWRRLSNCGHPDVVNAGQLLNSLRGRRNWADYDLETVFDQPLAFYDYHVAASIIDTLEAAEEESVRTRITEAMKTYERDVLREVTWIS